MLTLKTCGPLRGRLSVPGDKSISHRAVILGTLATGVTEVTGFLEAEDCQRTVACCQSLGATISRGAPGQLTITSPGAHQLCEPEEVLDCGNSGTALRLLAGPLASLPGHVVLTGDGSLRRRPMDRLVVPLQQMGGRLDGRAGGCYAPLAIRGARLRGQRLHLTVASAQVKSALLLAGLLATGRTELFEVTATRDHTERLLPAFGGQISRHDGWLTVEGEQPLRGCRLAIPGDFSSAAFWLVAATLVPGSDLLIEGVGVNPTRTGLLELVQAMGGQVELLNQRQLLAEPVADLRVKAAELKGLTVGAEMVPRTIDELLLFGLLASQAAGKSVLRGAEELRVKETDRLASLAKELGRLGARFTETADGFEIIGGSRLVGNQVTSQGDHRLALTLAVAGLIAEGQTRVRGFAAANVSYPGFAQTLQRLAPAALPPEANASRIQL